MKRFLLICGIGLDLVSGGSVYGDYPPPEDIFTHLVGDKWDMSARFKCLFNEVRNEAAKCRVADCVEPRKLVGEEKGLIALPKSAVPDTAMADVSLLNNMSLNGTLSDIFPSEENVFSLKESEKKKNGNPLYLADDERCWLRRRFVDGDFMVKIDGVNVFSADEIDELTGLRKYRDGFRIAEKDGCWKNEWYVVLTDVFKTLASRDFMGKLLGEATVAVFFDYAEASHTTVRVFCYPGFDRTQPQTVSFHLMYRQVLKGRRGVCYPLWIGFDFRYDIEKDCFTNDPVKLSTLRVGTHCIGTKKSIED